MTILTNRQERTRFLKFLAVGVIGAVVDFGLANFLSADMIRINISIFGIQFIHLQFKSFGMALVGAGTISFICAILSNFFWNRYWTYPDSRSRPVLRQLAMFSLVNIAGVAIRVPILWLLEPPMLRFFQGGRIRLPFSPDFLAKNATLAVAVSVVLLWNFFVNRYWTYNDVDKSYGRNP